MTVEAIVLASTTDDEPGSSLHRLQTQLHGLGVESVHVVAGPTAAKVAKLAERAGSRRLLLVDGELVMHDQALASLLADPRLDNAALVAMSSEHGAAEPGVRVQAGRIVSAASELHDCGDPTGRYLGVLLVRADQLAAAARQVAGTFRRRPAALSPVLLVALVRSGVAVTAVDLRCLFWARPADGSQTRAATAEVERLDEDRLWLDSAVKADDGFFGTFFVSPYSRFVARWAARRGVRPNTVTVLALLLALAAAALFAIGHRWDRVAGSVVLLLAFVLDCVDGQLARYTRRFTAFGAWLDITTDRVKEYAVYAGLAVGASRVTGVDLWVLAVAAMAVQTVRHLLDYTFPASRPVRPPMLALDRRDDGSRSQGVPAVVTLRPSWTRWPRRLLTLPIGERFAVICLTAAVWTPRVTFVTLLVWGGVAAAYGNTGRLLRSVA